MEGLSLRWAGSRRASIDDDGGKLATLVEGPFLLKDSIASPSILDTKRCEVFLGEQTAKIKVVRACNCAKFSP